MWCTIHSINTSEESSSEVDSNVNEVRFDYVVEEIIVDELGCQDFEINKVARRHKILESF